MELSLSSICLFQEYQTSPRIVKHSDQQKIKKRLKLLQHQLCHNILVRLKCPEWLDQTLIFVFGHGVITSVRFDENHSILSVYHDRFLMNKLTSKRISSVELTERFILVSYVEPSLACVSLEKNPMINGDDGHKKLNSKFKIKNNCPIRFINLERYIERFAKRSLAVSDNYALIWWNRMPHRHSWANQMPPNVEKNLIVFGFDDCQILESSPINGEILQANFVAREPSKFGVLHKHRSSVYNLTYLLYELIVETEGEHPSKTLNLVFEISIPMEKLCFYAEFTKLQDKILLLCDDESVMLFNIEQNVLYSLNSSIPICFISSYPLDSIFAACDQHGRVSFYDNAFNNIAYKIKSKTFNGGNHQDVCLNSNMSVKRLQFLSPNILITLIIENRRQESSLVKQNGTAKLLTTSNGKNRGNSCCLRLTILPYRITFQRLINEYLHRRQHEEALNVLRIINWNCSFEEAYLCVHTIFQHLIKLEPNDEMDRHIESTLAAFLIPMTPIDYKIFEKILPYIRQLAIRFFYHLVRNGSLAKAFQLGIELKSRRLFLILAQLFKLGGHDQQSMICYEQARNLL